MDQDEDKLHPEKSNRPIASGEISTKVALVYAILLAGLSFTIAYTLNFNVVVILLVYLCINLLYSTVLKNFVIVDLVIIGIGFLLRIYAGGLATEIPISDWLSIMVFLISLFMALAKRRDDALLYQKTKLDVRKNIKFYNLQFIDSTLSMLAGVVIVAYIMYSMSPALKERVGSEYIFMTSLFVIIGVMKYLHRIFSENEKGSPVNVLFSDRLIQLSLIGWLLTFYVLIYIS